MLNKAIRLAALLAGLGLAACGGGSEKQRFAEYEKAVEPILAEEAELLARYREKEKDAFAYAEGQGIRSLVVDRMVPFYREMEERLAAIRPGEGRLAEIHGILERSVDLRREFLEGYLAREAQVKAIAGATGQKMDEVENAWADADQAFRDLDRAARAAGDAAGGFAEIFQRERSVATSLETAISLLLTGRISPGDFLSAVENQFRPEYARFRQKIDDFDLSGGGMEMALAAKAYLEAMGGVLDAAAGLAEAAKAAGSTGEVPGDEELIRLWDQADETRRIYREDAKAYRAGLR